MELPRTSAVAARTLSLDRAGSTNDELLARATGAEASEWPSLSLVATDTQTAGRGRLGRIWTAPPASSLAASLLLRPRLPLTAYGWLPLLAGLAMTRTLRGAGAAATLKWPNDVLIGGRKVCGILAELLPDASGVVIGSGVNLTLGEEDLPVPTATSLRLEGVETTADAVLAGYTTEVAALLAAFEAAEGDAAGSGLRAAVTEACDTIGRAVRVELPSRGHLVGTAVGLDPDGRLLVQDEKTEPGRDAVAVAAGDVTHLRY